MRLQEREGCGQRGEPKPGMCELPAGFLRAERKIDSHRATDVRGALAALQDLASRHRAAVIGVTHPSKAGSNEALSGNRPERLTAA